MGQVRRERQLGRHRGGPREGDDIRIADRKQDTSIRIGDHGRAMVYALHGRTAPDLGEADKAPHCGCTPAARARAAHAARVTDGMSIDPRMAFVPSTNA